MRIIYIVMLDNIRVVCAYELLYGEKGKRNSLSLYASCIFFTYTHTKIKTSCIFFSLTNMIHMVWMCLYLCRDM